MINHVVSCGDENPVWHLPPSIWRADGDAVGLTPTSSGCCTIYIAAHWSSEKYLAPSYNTHSENVSGVLPSYSSAPSSIDYTSEKSEAPMLTYSSLPTSASSGDGQGTVVNTALFYTSSTLSSIDYGPQNVSDAQMLAYSSSPASGSFENGQSSTASTVPFYFLAPPADSSAATGSMNRADQEAPSYAAVPSTYGDDATIKVQSHSLSQRITKNIRSLFRFFPVEEVPNAEKVINNCRETVQNSAKFWSTIGERRADHYLNWHQCDFLVRRLIATDSTLAAIQQSPLLGENTLPALQELHQSLRDAKMLMEMSHITTTQWLGAAMKQGDLKETFSHLLYDIQWHTSVLQSILVENSKESSVEFDPTLCDCRLSAGDELELLTAMKKDEEKLSNRLSAAVEHLGASKAEGKFAGKLHEKIVAHSPDLIFVNLDDLDLDGGEIGRGSFGVVKDSKFLDCECVVKVLEDFPTSAIEQEMDAIKKLGNHPHIVRLFCYSKTDPESKFYLVLEQLQMDLKKALRLEKKKLPLVEAVSLMLQIGEGMKYMHGKGVAHRGLKPENVLVNLERSSGVSRIRSVKIADFGTTKAADRTQTNTINIGTTKYMAPEVMTQEGKPKKVRLNLLKADVYSFAIMSIEILTGSYPYDFDNMAIRERSKAGERPILRKLSADCPLRLTTLLTKCWAGIPHERPLFPEICRELRYIKGLLLKGDEQKLQTQIPGPLRPMEGVKLQGPWGDPKNGRDFFDMATSIKGITLRYSTRPGIVGLLKVTYEILHKTFEKESYVMDKGHGQYNEKIEFKPEIEYIKQISGFVSELDVKTQNSTRITIKIVSSLTIHTNLQTYGPFGEERGMKFTSDEGSRVIGFYGRAGNMLDSLGVVTIPDV
ncbi:uncharacterized protein [Physcomitrium patens]|uniref:uncharacterized protein isoform X2 n=1 Tax=Physcomitrium patens TaxID=3218 RepID=UPI000D15798C|nr:uncharacterized protein LOC112275753 isoform X2 [Physcomitrium patens]|eukprot:XP_024362153.1 uncharacterized protein LOC112275753 isoform X2 [Physcomitrella patens]